MDEPDESPASLIGVALAALIALGIVLALVFAPAHPRLQSDALVADPTGVVISAGPISLGRLSGGTRELVNVRLPDGTVVAALVASGGPMSAGQRVTLTKRIKLFGNAPVPYDAVPAR